VCRSANGSGEYFAGNEEGDAVGAELVEEGGKEVHGLESLDTLWRGVILVVECGDNEHDKTHQETDLLHHLTAVELVVDEERGEMVASQRDDDIVQVPDPARQNRGRVAADDSDELGLEELVAVEEYVVAKPCSSRGEQPTTEEGAGQPERLDIVACDIALPLRSGELATGMGHLVGAIVHEPKGADSRHSKRNTPDPLGGRSAIRRVAVTVVQDQKQEDEESLVDKLTPTLHEEGQGDLTSTVHTIFAGRQFSSRNCVLH